jgi:hypothetical protein
MKKTIAILAAAALTFGAAGSAFAKGYRLSPEGMSFTGTGTTSATKNGITLKCKATFQGHVDDTGVGFVDSGSFKGQVGCTAVGLGGLPWTSTAKNAKKVDIANVSFTSPIGNCGPGDLLVTVTDGTIKFKNLPLAGDCVVSGTIKTSPALAIVPK